MRRLRLGREVERVAFILSGPASAGPEHSPEASGSSPSTFNREAPWASEDCSWEKLLAFC